MVPKLYQDIRISLSVVMNLSDVFSPALEAQIEAKTCLCKWKMFQLQ